MKTKRITIRDIANDTGFSIATISKYLNDKPIPIESKNRIEASIKKLNYIPKLSAQNLRSKKSSSVLILTPELDRCHYFWGSLIGNIEEELRGHGYSTVITSRLSIESPASIHKLSVISRQFAGIIFIPYSSYDTDIVQHFSKDLLCPCVILDQILKGCSSDVITSANYQAAYDATCYLIRQGHTKISAIGGPSNSYTAMERKRGYVQALKDNGILFHPNFAASDFSSFGGQHAFTKIMQLSNPPTAIFSLNYDNTLGCITAASALGLQIPTDISFVSFDDGLLLRSMSPQISVIAQDVASLSHSAVEVLLLRIRGDTSPSVIKLIPTEFIDRDSIKKQNIKERSPE